MRKGSNWKHIVVALVICLVMAFISTPGIVASAESKKADNDGKVKDEGASIEQILEDLARGIEERDKILKKNGTLAEAFAAEYEVVSEYANVELEQDKELNYLIRICVDSLQNIAEFAELEEKTQERFGPVLRAEIRVYESVVDVLEEQYKDIDDFELKDDGTSDDESEQSTTAGEGSKNEKAASKSQDEPKTVTRGMSNALESAKSYLKYTSFSYDGLIEMLEFEGYTEEEAKYGVDHCGADWNEQALKSGENYLKYTSFSYKGLVEMLEFEGFTNEQAKYAADILYEE